MNIWIFNPAVFLPTLTPTLPVPELEVTVTFSLGIAERLLRPYDYDMPTALMSKKMFRIITIVQNPEDVQV